MESIASPGAKLATKRRWQMFKPLRTAAALPAQDLERAKAFYRDKLGLTPALEDATGLMYLLAAGAAFGAFPSSGNPSGPPTQMAIQVEELEPPATDVPPKAVTSAEHD